MKKGEIWLVELPSSKKGHEQSGSRPVIIISNTDTNIVIIIPFTSNLQTLKFNHTMEIKPTNNNGLNDTSVAEVFQIRAIDKIRLKHKIGNLDESVLNEINNVLRDLLNL